MARQSLKQRLIAELERRVDELERGETIDLPAGARELSLEVARWHVRELRARGSGPLPYWARRLAGELGLDVDRRSASAIAT